MKLFTTTTRSMGLVCGVPSVGAARVITPEFARRRGGWALRAFVPQTAGIVDHNWTGVSAPGGPGRSTT
ncbi:hypothetical protein [Pseudonocardia xishanensis]|uniref:Uncharacterized protein n=1 Tax=Pseudonocardia xishanensis TaxID=630995 RepID=A0ABP8S4C1_9PSEU